MDNLFTAHAGVRHPIICGAMYPCSNPELVAAASNAGGLGVMQPLSLTHIRGMDLRDGIRRIRALTPNPIGFNALLEASSPRHLAAMEAWVELALEEGIRFFITALGKPHRIVEKVHAAGGRVYHDVTGLTHAQKAVEAGVDGLICVNNRAGGHAGALTPEELYRELEPLNLPMICAGGVGDRQGFKEALATGYQAVQMGTRFIATAECDAPEDYKQAILNAGARDIVLTRKISGVPVAVINTPSVQRSGTEPGPLASFLLRWNRTKKYMRMFYGLRSADRLKRQAATGGYDTYYMAGKSVQGVREVKSVQEVFNDLLA